MATRNKTKAQQELFDKRYISSNEITNSLGISRTAITFARRRGQLPEPIIVPGSGTQLWIRSEVAPILKDWKKDLTARRG